MHYGYTDLSGQLRSALDQFTGVQLIPFSFVALLIIFYILLIGPGDYFFLRKIVRRMEWTWLTFPIIVLVVSGAAYMLAYYLKGDQLRVNQADLVDVDAASGFVRGTTWLNIFSPRMESFNLSLQPQLPDGKDGCKRPIMVRLVGIAGRGAGRHESARRQSDALARTLQFRSRSERNAGRAHPGLVDEKFHRALVGLDHRLSPGRIGRRGSIACRLDHQYARFSLEELHFGL